MNRHSTDVLIIGAGGAGLRAAIEARRQGVRVLLISKGKAGSDGCTAASMGSFRVSGGETEIKEYIHETLDAGRYLNNAKLVDVLVNEANASLAELESFDIHLNHEEEGKAALIAPQPAGAALSRKLYFQARQYGIEVIEKAHAFSLLVEDNRCHGAMALEAETGRIICLSAKATILATGGYAGLFLRNDNPAGIIGTGIVLAFQSGGDLQDLEYIQFQPAIIDHGVPRMPILDWLIEAAKCLVPGGPLINKKGERVLQKYDLLRHKIFRDNLTVAIEKEIAGEDDETAYVALDLRKIRPTEIERLFETEFHRQLVRRFNKIFSTRTLHLGSSAHYTMGGIKIDEKCQTTIEGLYAAGEAAGGIHGANRIGGNALTEIIVFGKIAGREASEWARTSKLITRQKRLRKEMRTIREYFNKDGKSAIRPSNIKHKIRMILSRYCGPLRSEERLLTAFQQLRIIEGNVSRIHVNDTRSLQEAIECKSIALLAMLIVRSALARQESRGAHYRLDYPYRDDKNWLKNKVIRRENNEPVLYYENNPS